MTEARILGTGVRISIGEKFADLVGFLRGMELRQRDSVANYFALPLAYGIKWEYSNNDTMKKVRRVRDASRSRFKACYHR